ncbi:MAG: GNAT family N-acetyltransferase, partial [Oscillospiraceae bacterium]|nr:GNAT family N-acetyltransferase [Oscillospiraceae bacterium]
KDGGHIGYAIASPYRGKGYGNELLRLLLVEAGKMCIHEVHVNANKDNEPSNKVIIAHGGRLLRETEEKNYYIISLV